MDADKAIANLERILSEFKQPESLNGHRSNPPVDMKSLRDMDFNYEWLVDGFWPMGAHVHIFASPKTGKSMLMLWIACCIAIGRDPFTGQPAKQQRVTYIDNEMTLKDLRDRIMDMEFDFDALDGWLMYHQYPTLAPMDTELGGVQTQALLNEDESRILIIDTLSRVVKGEENSNDTYQNFYNYTGRLLKANEVSMVRLDHAGHDPKKSRGASAKADDVDLVYSLEKKQDDKGRDGFRLTRTHSRIGFSNEVINLLLTDEPICIKSSAMRMWTAQAIAKAKELDELAAPINVSQRDAIKLLKAAGIGPGKTTYLAEALRLRLSKLPNLQGM